MVIMDENGWLGADGKYYPDASGAHRSFAEKFRWEKPSPPAYPKKQFQRLRVFLCHAKEDKPKVQELYYRLSASGLEPWLDEKNLLPGQTWESEITQAIRESDCVLVCLSHTATTKTGYVQKEIREALERADERPEGQIFLIPLRFDQCDVPKRFSKIQWVDYFEPDGYERLLLAFDSLSKWLNSANRKVLPPMPIGEILYLSSDERNLLIDIANEPSGTGVVRFRILKNGVSVDIFNGDNYENFVKKDSLQEVEHWKSVMNKLVTLNLLEQRDKYGEIFAITEAGYNAVFTIPSFK